MALLESVTFALGVASASIILGTLLVTILGSSWRFWPPGEKTWKYHLHWICVGLFNISLIGTAVFEWGTWTLPRPSSFVVGGVLAVVGIAIFATSERSFDRHETMGLAGDLHTSGLYARSRNPQYVGMIVGVVGFAVVVNSLSVTILALLHVAWVALLPFAEEPWLQDEYGEEYQRYKQQVPRFVGVETFRSE
ncbi:methyltransferase family protein [Haloferax sp. DFSO52]|uniref:methyltransferase family protein n=1 Tax=Haloferax sp. DFSO52 TaxID=3388505 RepID=UPI003A83E3F8